MRIYFFIAFVTLCFGTPIYSFSQERVDYIRISDTVRLRGRVIWFDDFDIRIDTSSIDSSVFSSYDRFKKYFRNIPIKIFNPMTIDTSDILKIKYNGFGRVQHGDTCIDSFSVFNSSIIRFSDSLHSVRLTGVFSCLYFKVLLLDKRLFFSKRRRKYEEYFILVDRL
ncbi:MAG: hypothetical protein QM731_24960 [Chitinophagaceae bacterium]